MFGAVYIPRSQINVFMRIVHVSDSRHIRKFKDDYICVLIRLTFIQNLNIKGSRYFNRSQERLNFDLIA